jgi:hypothetical protein
MNDSFLPQCSLFITYNHRLISLRCCHVISKLCGYKVRLYVDTLPISKIIIFHLNFHAIKKYSNETTKVLLAQLAKIFVAIILPETASVV